ncbi:MAG: hypothetical protein MZW92_38915 [Comamonadaceae bacterium]|nr:hypothetical protein [Comamonadaceae bacterium]
MNRRASATPADASPARRCPPRSISRQQLIAPPLRHPGGRRLPGADRRSAWRRWASVPRRSRRNGVHQPLAAARRAPRRCSSSPATPTSCRPARWSSGDRDPFDADDPRRHAVRPRRRPT